jgi:hypothetical protein
MQRKLSVLGFCVLTACHGLEPGPDFEVNPASTSDITAPPATASGNADPERAPAIVEPPSDSTPATSPADPNAKKEYVGKLAVNTPKAFGGSGHCNYTVTMKDVTVTLDITDKIIGAKVTNVMVEELKSSCGMGAAPPNPHEYRLTEGTYADLPTDKKVQLKMSGNSDNGPNCILTMTVAKKDDGYDVTLIWQRDDGQAAPLMWITGATLVVTSAA